MLYESDHFTELKKNQISYFKSRLDQYSISYVEFSFLEDGYILDELQKTDAVFILYDKELEELFDDKSSADNKYKYIGKQLYLKYFNNGFENHNYYTFLINNCSSVNYYWLEYLHKKYPGETVSKTKSIFLIKEDFNINFKEIDTFLSNFSNN